MLSVTTTHSLPIRTRNLKCLSYMIHWFSCDTNLAPVGRDSPPPKKKNSTKELGNANHAYKGSNNNKKRVWTKVYKTTTSPLNNAHKTPRNIFNRWLLKNTSSAKLCVSPNLTAHAIKIKNSHTPKNLTGKKTVSTTAVVQSSEKLIKHLLNLRGWRSCSQLQEGAPTSRYSAPLACRPLITTVIIPIRHCAI